MRRSTRQIHSGKKTASVHSSSGTKGRSTSTTSNRSSVSVFITHDCGKMLRQLL